MGGEAGGGRRDEKGKGSGRDGQTLSRSHDDKARALGLRNCAALCSSSFLLLPG